MAAVTICRDFGAPQNKVLSLFPLFPHLFAMKWWDRMPWSLFSECWILSQLFQSHFFTVISFLTGHLIFFFFLTSLCWVLIVAHKVFNLCCSRWDLVPWPGIEAQPLYWECRVLATGPPGNSLANFFNVIKYTERTIYHLNHFKIQWRLVHSQYCAMATTV